MADGKYFIFEMPITLYKQLGIESVEKGFSKKDICISALEVYFQSKR